jgi:hypothetical protein
VLFMDLCCHVVTFDEKDVMRHVHCDLADRTMLTSVLYFCAGLQLQPWQVPGQPWHHTRGGGLSFSVKIK